MMLCAFPYSEALFNLMRECVSKHYILEKGTRKGKNRTFSCSTFSRIHLSGEEYLYILYAVQVLRGE